MNWDSFREQPAATAKAEEIITFSSPPASPRPFSQAPPNNRSSTKCQLIDSDEDEDTDSDVMDIHEDLISSDADHQLDIVSNMDVDQPPMDLDHAIYSTNVEVHSSMLLKKEPEAGARPSKRMKMEEVGPQVIAGDTSGSKEKRKRKNTAPRKKGLLPAYCHDGNKWSRVFIATFLKWLACQISVWGPTNMKILDAIRYIWRAVYNEDLPLEQDTFSGPAFAICKQKANEWRSNFGSTAIAALCTSFVKQGMYGSDDAVQQRTFYSKGLLAQNTFLYEDVVDGKPLHTFRGKLYLVTLATHYSAIRNAVDVPQLRLPSPYTPWGAMTLCCAAGERACRLASIDKLGDISDVLISLARHHEIRGSLNSTVSKAKSLLAGAGGRKQVNVRTGKASTSLLNFSEANYKKSTDMFWKSVKGASALFLLEAFNATAIYAPNARKEDNDEDEDEDSEDEDEHEESDVDDPRAHLDMNWPRLQPKVQISDTPLARGLPPSSSRHCHLAHSVPVVLARSRGCPFSPPLEHQGSLFGEHRSPHTNGNIMSPAPTPSNVGMTPWVKHRSRSRSDSPKVRLSPNPSACKLVEKRPALTCLFC
ncbi:hypothetical protein CONPUDRAFT_151498 [Coniophora puteana RWD-64-598 SS2]|uniref:Uncharacterized protein n=1 Tax=Coniophora puteana (strain RWD-64-598) TaxID=741705 RepID=A0A5M3MZA5_CONPW|nr:uncharacterized protein CONPUDRAFT_151498 [Coniophora puteana RWD-64-598 SS2]EIW84480.1 hypothetical protein CONPUDRAFT_151498 [Coniophora puteana RWD-64-598 SS2]